MKKITLRIKELWAMLCMIVSYVIAQPLKTTHPLWLFSERGTDARDNGFWMFRYVKEHHPEINAKYVISRDSVDYLRLKEWGEDIIYTNSLRHYVKMWQADNCLSTHNCGCFPYYVKKIPVLSRIVRKLNKKMQIVWLQHGVIMHDLPSFHYEKLVVDKMICGAYPEYQFLLSTFGIPKEVACYTGLARFDGLHNPKVKEGQILLMPTWRKWLHKENFLKSQFWKAYSLLLTNPDLHRFLQEKGQTLVFYPHHEMQPYLAEFERLDLPDCIQLAHKSKYDVQTLLKESALLITDYSSVFFDFAYMYKPVILFLFDNEEFHQKHYPKGYFDFKHCFATWTDDIASLLAKIKEDTERNHTLSDEQKVMIDEYFPLHDAHNCERIYHAVTNQRHI